MTQQAEHGEVAYADLQVEMDQMREFLNDPGNPNAVAGQEPKPPAEAEAEQPVEADEELVEGEEELVEGEEGAADEESEGTPAEPQFTAEEVQAQQAQAAEQARQQQLEIQFHSREAELMQREAEIKRQQADQQRQFETQRLNEEQAQAKQALIDSFQLEDGQADTVARALRQGWDEVAKMRADVTQYKDYIRTAVRASYVLGQQYGVSPDELFPADASEVVTFAQMKAKAESLGKTAALERENQELKQSRVPKQQFARPQGTTAGRSHDQLVDSAMSKPEWERTPAEKAALAKEAGAFNT